MIVWKDILKPRYAVIFVVDSLPEFREEIDGRFTILGEKYFACVKDRPYKRPLDVPFNVFYNELSKKGNVVAGHYWTLRMLTGIGSCYKNNIDNPNIFKTRS